MPATGRVSPAHESAYGSSASYRKWHRRLSSSLSPRAVARRYTSRSVGLTRSKEPFVFSGRTGLLREAQSTRRLRWRLAGLNFWYREPFGRQQQAAGAIVPPPLEIDVDRGCPSGPRASRRRGTRRAG